MTAPIFSKTSRGFIRLDFQDRNGSACSLQKSSIAVDQCIWFGLEDADPQVLAHDAKALGLKPETTTGWVPYPMPLAVNLSTRMHLSQEQVRALLPALQHFAEHGELPETGTLL